MRGQSIGLALGGALLAGASAASAAETVTYSYDALGRLTQVQHTGGDNNGMVQSYGLDPAGNRTSYTVTGSKNKGLPETMVIVLPLNGFTVIPISQ